MDQQRSIRFVVGNCEARIVSASDTILRVLDAELRYPTEHAMALASGWRPPGAEYGGWDGWIRLLKQRKTDYPSFPTGLLPKAVRLAHKFRHEVQIEDQRQRPEQGLPEFPEVSLRDYQRVAVEEAIKRGRGVLDLPPRAGKTRIAAELQRRLGLPTLWLAPTDRIVQQTVEVLTDLFGANYARRPESGSQVSELAGTPVAVMTASMAARVAPEWYRSREVLLVDEWHHCLAPQAQVMMFAGGGPVWGYAEKQKPIEQVRVGDLVWSADIAGYTEPREVLNVWKRKAPQNMLRLQTALGHLDVTDEHRIYTDKGKLRARELRVGDYLLAYISRTEPVRESVRICDVTRLRSSCEYVYDLEVEENHNYFAGGVLVSNSAAKTYSRDIFSKCDHIFYRYGMTGTHFRSGSDELAMHALLSDTIFRMTPDDLMRRGHLVPTHTVFLPVDVPRLRGAGSTFHGGFGEAGIHGHQTRNQMAAEAAVSLLQLGRHPLVLVGTKNQGEAIRELLSRMVPNSPPGAQFRSVEFISTNVRRHKQQQIIDSYLGRQEVRILIGTSLLGEGVDLPAADALVYARGEKAEVTLTQAVYRVGTAHEGKRSAIVVDFADRHHRHLRDHSLERLRLYYREPTFTITILDHPSQLAGWAEQVL